MRNLVVAIAVSLFILVVGILHHGTQKRIENIQDDIVLIHSLLSSTLCSSTSESDSLEISEMSELSDYTN
jgi:hypothetical protein